MAQSLRNSPLRSLCALAAGTLLFLQVAIAAGEKTESVQWTAARSIGIFSDVVSHEKLVVREGSSLVMALKAESTFKDGPDNSTWKLAGDVHLEFDGATLDAQAATVTFVNGRLSSVIVQASAPKLPMKLVHVVFKSAVLDVDHATIALTEGRIKSIRATGTPTAPTKFSYQLTKQTLQVDGRADRIDYDGAKDLITFSGNTSYTDGKRQATASSLAYSFTTELAEVLDFKGLIPPREDRVPQIRTPERATAR